MMLERRLFSYLITTVLLIPCLLCDVSSNDKSKNYSMFSRLSVEEIDNTTVHKNITDSAQDHLVSFMLKNAKDIFGSEDEVATTATDTSLLMFTVSLPVDYYNDTPKLQNSSVLLNNSVSGTNEISKDDATTKSDLFVGPFINFTEPENDKKNYNESKQETATLDYPAPNRSCIFCDNVAYDNCVNPANKLVPTTDCTQTGDMCYSMHTPFGIIERGCFNINHNLTIYVCSCNLCNHIPIGEMPYMFIDKRDWLANVIELTHVKRLRQSVMKNMACLRCETNTTAGPKQLSETSNFCLEGKIGYLPTQVCHENEVCGVKCIKGEGYVWRGCVKFPLYNYWWQFCDTNHCNHDKLTSIYDPM